MYEQQHQQYERSLRDPYLEKLDTLEHTYVNAHISNISFPNTIEELETVIYQLRQYSVEAVTICGAGSWTVPRSAQKGDIVLFYHAKTAISRITSLITRVKDLPDGTNHDKELLLSWLDRARRLYYIYGGKVFAIGRILGKPAREFLDAEEEYHWSGRVYANIGETANLERPIDISEFNSFIKISRQSGITPLPAREFNHLREIIIANNSYLPSYFLKCEIGNFILSHINRENFLNLTHEYRRRFLLEIDFRSYYVDYLFKSFVKRQFWSECICHTAGKPHYYVDNVFRYNGNYYLLEVKLNIYLEHDLHDQLKQYVNANYIFLDKEKTKKVSDFERNFMYVIDTEAFYRYDTATDSLTSLVRLDDVHSIENVVPLLPF